jgi:hypothetical protein
MFNHFEACGVCHQPICCCFKLNVDDWVMKSDVHIIRLPSDPEELEVTVNEETRIVTVKKKGLLVVIGPDNHIKIERLGEN